MLFNFQGEICVFQDQLRIRLNWGPVEEVKRALYLVEVPVFSTFLSYPLSYFVEVSIFIIYVTFLKDWYD
jgi:hypothetical protein